MAEYQGNIAGIGQAQAQTQTATSLNGDLNRACGRVTEMLSRLVKIADQLHGGQPRPPDINKIPSPTPSLRRELDLVHQLLSECESEITRIEGRL